jgi:hypothetical protein
MTWIYLPRSPRHDPDATVATFSDSMGSYDRVS